MGSGDIGKALGGITDAVGITNYSGDRAQEAQQNAANQANQTAKSIYDQQRADQEPWRQAGISALSGIQDNKFMDNWQQQDPGYQSRMNEGLKAVQGSAAARGLGNSGAALKELTKYGQDYASNEYDKAYNRNYGRLSQLAGFGTGATNANNQNLGSYGSQVSGNQIGMGNAAATNEIGQSGRMATFLNGAIKANGEAAGKAAIVSSDERLKTNIRPVTQDEMKEMKSILKAFHFNYTNDSRGKGDWVGIMAQDLEKSDLGKNLVVEDDKGYKTISLEKVMSMFLATMAEG